MECMKQKALCVPEHLAASILRKGFTPAHDGQMDGRLVDLMAHARPQCRAVTPLDSGMVWLAPYVVVGNQAGHSCLVSRRKEPEADYFEPFSLGVTGYCRENETADMAAARILLDTTGIPSQDVVRAGFSGFVWLSRSRYEATHIGLIYRVLVDAPGNEVRSSACFKGKWMERGDVFNLFNLDAMTPLSKYLFRRQGSSELFMRLLATALDRAMFDVMTKMIEGGNVHEASDLGC